MQTKHRELPPGIPALGREGRLGVGESPEVSSLPWSNSSCEHPTQKWQVGSRQNSVRAFASLSLPRRPPTRSLTDLSKALAAPISGRGGWWVPGVPSAWRGGCPGRRPKAGPVSGRARGWGPPPPQTASQALGPSTHGDQQGWPWGRSVTRSWKAKTLRATIALTSNPTSCKRKPGPGLHRGTEHEKAAQPGELVWPSGREQEGGVPARTFRRTSRPWFTTLC